MRRHGRCWRRCGSGAGCGDGRELHRRLIAGALTEIAGSSDVVDRGFVTYSNAAKTAMLGVDPAVIKAHGAVSEAVAAAMAAGALERSDAHVTVAVTGVAGPGGGTVEKPVGTVWFGLAVTGSSRSPSGWFSRRPRGRASGDRAARARAAAGCRGRLTRQGAPRVADGTSGAGGKRLPQNPKLSRVIPGGSLISPVAPAGPG